AGPVPATSPGSGQSGVPSAPRSIVAGILGEPSGLNPNILAGVIQSPGAGDSISLINGKLGVMDDNGNLRAQLAEQVPTVENGLWKLLGDGRMETTWKLRPDARWHDGSVITADDVVFTSGVARNKELPQFRDPAYDLVESVEALDAHTVLVRWLSPYIDGDRLYASARSALLPQHLLGEAYGSNQSGFTAYRSGRRRVSSSAPGLTR
ncbi:MAG TPA: ABC transporter substrate-binding protein, partial [Chloroflexota bacterium]